MARVSRLASPLQWNIAQKKTAFAARERFLYSYALNVFDFSESFEAGVPVGGAEAIALTERIFSGDSPWLKTCLRMESRPQQTNMALAAARAFSASAALLFEAGTGVGKSLAYLLPGIIFSLLSGKKLVVSTNTIPLQEQILKKDLPICRKLFSRVPELQKYENFKVVLMVGKANYLCGTRLAQALKRHEGIFDGNDGSDTARELLLIRDWAAQPDCTGLREHLPQRVSDEVWEMVNADSAACSRKNCSHKNCFYQRARAALDAANLVVVNHHLLFSLIGAGAVPQGDETGILYPNDFVVIDEAHRVPDVATDYFGVEISSTGLLRLLSRVANAYKKGGVLREYGRNEGLNLIAEAKSAVEDFFSDLRFRFLEKNKTFRFRERDWAQNVCEIPLGKLENKLKQIAQIEERSHAKDEINDFAKRIEAHRLAIRECLELRNAPQNVYWATLGTGKFRTVTLCGKPVDVAKQLAATLFSRKTGIVLSSATLSDGNAMTRFRKRCGADLVDENILSLRENSPFDYEKNMEIFLAKNLPEPDKENGALATEHLAEICAHCVKNVPAGGTLILCTSYEICRALAHGLRERISDASRKILVQGEDFSRQELIARFVAAGNAVLIGTSSFWTGIDVPGAALSQVIITRLPFANPREPLVEARGEWIAENGGKPFFEMSVPDAVLQFRQGIGRLIRKASDRGRIVILDSRMLNKTYGKRFLAALPHSRHCVFMRENFREAITPFE